MKKQNEHDDPSLETAVFLIKSSYYGGFYWQPPKTKEPITRAQGLRVIGSASMRLAL